MERLIPVVCVRNPFDPELSREIKSIEPGKTVRDALRLFYDDLPEELEVVPSVDGLVLEERLDLDRVLRPGETVAFCARPAGGGGKDILRAVAMLGVLLAAPYLGEMAAGTFGAMLGGQAGVVAYGGAIYGAVTIGTIVVGGLIVNSVFRPSFPDVTAPTGLESSPTYSWEPKGNAVVEGVALPELFGTHRVQPPIIGKYIETIGDKQYLNVLMAVTGSELASMASVWINENPLEYFEGVQKEIRLGAVDQPIIPFFNDTRVDNAVGSKLTWPNDWDAAKTYAEGELVTYPTGTSNFWKSIQPDNINNIPAEGSYWTADENWTTRITSGNLVQGIGITIGLPKGLFYVNNSGGMDKQTVKVQIEFKKVGDPTWTRYKLYTTTETTIVTGRWSAGYYIEWTWYEYEAGSATPGDHTEGEVYIPAQEEWNFNVGESGGYLQIRPAIYWRWVVGETVVEAYEEYSDYAIIYEGRTTMIHRSYFRDNLTEGQYEIRCRLVEKLPSDTRYGNDTYWESFCEIVYDDFQFPGVSLLAVRALATDKISGGMPRIDLVADRGTVPVFTGSVYEQKASDNPAWASYHVLHKARWKGTGDGTDPDDYIVFGKPASKFIYEEFESWGAWCDLKGYKVNLYIDSPLSVQRILDIIGMNGRGAVVPVGSKYGCIVDRPEETPVQRFLFGMGNIESDSFSQEWLPMDGRADAIEITFRDASLEWTPQTVTVYSQDYDSTDREPSPTQVNLLGCTSRTLAMKYGQYLLRCNRYLTLTANWGADVDAIASRRGDVVEASHDVPQFGYSGRVVGSGESGGVLTQIGDDGAVTEIGADGAYVVTGGDPYVSLDRNVTLLPGVGYVLRVRHQEDDVMETYNCLQVPAEVTTNMVFLQSYSRLPSKYTNYAFGEVGRAFKEVRITGISRDSDMRVKLTALEYVAEVHDDDAEVPPPVQVSDLPMTRRLKATEVWRGGAETKVYLSWEGYAFYWNIFQDGQKIGTAFVTNFEIGGLGYGVTYQFTVSHTENPADGETVLIQLRGKIDPPGDVLIAYATIESYGILIEWVRVYDFDVAGYEIRLGDAEGDPFDWGTASLIVRTSATAYRWNIQVAGTYTLLLKAYDVFGNYSTNAKIVIPVIGTPPAVNRQFFFSGPNVVLTWEAATSSFPISEYEIRYGDEYETSTFLDSTKALGYTTKVTWSGPRRFWITAIDVAGNYGTPTSVDVIVTPPGIPTGLNAQVIDNNILLRWSAPSTGSLPIEYYEILRGDTLESAFPVGQKSGTFTVIFESEAGTYTYWVRGYDTAGNVGGAASIPATMSQPPDYVLFIDWEDDFSGTKSNALLESGNLVMPVNTTETWEEHFISRGWTSPQDQINVGYPYYLEPVPSTSYYERTFDYGQSISLPVMITLSLQYQVIDGSPSITPKISVSLNGTDWTDYDDTLQVIESNFRYVKYRVTVASIGGNDFLVLSPPRVKLNLKEKSESGIVEVTTQGIQVDFTGTFLDITSLTATPINAGATLLIAVVDFQDVPSPDHFHVYLYYLNGTSAAGAGYKVGWAAKGV